MLAQAALEYEALHESGPAEAVVDSPRSGKKSPCKVLVVDDDPLVRWSVSETLTEQGFEVAEAPDAATALQVLSHGDVNVVLLDLRLPDAADLRVLSAMRQLKPSTAVILMTSYGSPELLERAKRLGAFDTVDKPFEIAALVPLVEHAARMAPPRRGSRV
jgi:two-component system, NtrC family, response regulator AtoC